MTQHIDTIYAETKTVKHKQIAGDSKTDESIYRKILAESPDDPGVIFNSGLRALQNSLYPEAIQLFDSLASVGPGYPDLQYYYGVALRSVGQLNEAMNRFHQAVKLKPSHSSAWLDLAEVCVEAEMPESAYDAFKNAIALDGNNAYAHYNFANLLYQSRKFEEAEAHYQKAIQFRPNWIDAYCNLGNTYLALGKNELAVDAYEKALKLNPGHVEIHCNIANAYAKQGRLDEALVSCKKTVNLKPNYADGHYNLGNFLVCKEQYKEALDSYTDAINADPTHVNAIYNMGNVFQELKRYEQAVKAYKAVIRIQPRHVEAYINMGYSLTELDRLDEAQTYYDRALAFGLNDPRIYCNIGNIFSKRERYAEAIDAYGHALCCRKDFEEVYFNLAAAFEKQKDIANALAVQKKAIESCPPSVNLNNQSLLRFIMFGLWNEGEPFFDRVISDHYRESDIEQLDKALFVLNTSFLPWQKILLKHVEWGKLQLTRCQRQKIEFTFVGKKKGNTPKIGYVSPDFRSHSVGLFFREIITHHDKDSFPIYCYSLHSQEDHITNEIERHATAFKRVGNLEPNEIARQIHDDDIDILVDLAGHTKGNKLEIFGYKPAPIQITAIGYPNGIGLPTIDYRITDGYADVDSADNHYIENLIRLPRCFLPFIRLSVSEISFSKEDFGLPSQSQTLVSFNALHKLNPRVLQLWDKILKALPRAFLLCSYENSHIAELKNNIKKHFKDNIDRVIILPRAESPEIHRARYKMADIALDTFPYSGTTTSYEALYMGVPIVTLVGERHVQRTTYSFLKNIGLEETIAYSEQEYFEKVIRMVVDKKLRAYLKAKIKKNICIPQLGPEMYTRYLEESYLEMWVRN